MVFTNIQPFPFQMSPLSNVTPFTYRDGQTFQEKLELMRVWLNQSLVPDTDAAIAHAIDEFQTGITNAEQTVLTSKAGWQTTYDAFVASFNTEWTAFKNTVDAANATFETGVNTRMGVAEADITAAKTDWLNRWTDFTNNVQLELAALSDAAMGGLIDGGTSVTAVALNKKYIQAVIASGPGIDPTGATDSTAAIQTLITNAPDGSQIHFPDGAVFQLSAKLAVTKRLTFTGAGELRWLAGIDGNAAIEVTGDGVTFQGIRMTNPNELGNKTEGSARPYGILFRANHGTVTESHIERFQNCIAVAADGEWHDFTISNNRIKDVIGGGGGPANTTSGDGEDRGDGITIWGAAATITGNVVNAKPGTDARIGIHVEALSEYETDTTFTNRDSLATISGNVVYGPFRRGVVNEGMSNVSIIANTVADATWWGICSAETQGTVIEGNTIKWTRTADNVAGQAWSVSRAGIGLMNGAQNLQVKNNVITAVAGSNIPYGIYVFATDTKRFNDLVISGNTIRDDSGTMGIGIFLDNWAGVRTVIRENKILNFQGKGIYGYRPEGISIDGNQMLASTPATKGIQLEAVTTSRIRATGNLLLGNTTGDAIDIANSSGSMTIVNNEFVDWLSGLVLYGLSGDFRGTLNTYDNVTNQVPYTLDKNKVTILGNTAPHYAEISWAPGQVNSGGTSVTSPDISLPSANVGDIVAIHPPNIFECSAFAYVASPGIVKIVVTNGQAVNANLTQNTWGVRLIGK